MQVDRRNAEICHPEQACKIVIPLFSISEEMIIYTTVKETQKTISALRETGKSIGFVATMGALHEGHLSLIRRSKKENDITVCSIFVNPIQFNNKEDLIRYPRTLEKDCRLLENEGCDFVFAPDMEEMYPGGEKPKVEVDFGMLDKVMEGKFRPGHFNGVAIVVKRLFDIIDPSRAYFGKKDFQQLAVIKHLVKTMKLPLEIVSCDTVREPDGLAMSSRNMRLTVAQRMIAPHIYHVLRSVKEKAGIVPVKKLKSWAILKIHEKQELRVEYLEVDDKDTLLPLNDWSARDRAVALAAVYLGDVRLIDNIELFS